MTTVVEPLHVGDVGTVFQVSITENGSSVDIHTATTKQIILKPPTGPAVTKAAAFYTDGVDGILTCVTLAADLSVAGRWQIQGHVILPTGEWHSSIHRFTVEANLA